VNQALLVRVGERGGHLLHDGQGHLHRQGRAGEPLQQATAGQVGHRQVELAVSFAHVKDWDDVGVLQLRDLPRLVEEALRHLRFFTVAGMQYLERDDAPQARIAGLVHGGKAAAAQF
jgi:hypothetical protein